jgi:AraC-like DNA-binding protein
MEHEMDRGLNIEQISRAFQVSRSTLFLQFRNAFGRSPMAVLQELRTARACRLLRETALPVREVARTCGYSDPLYFTRDFTRRQGVSPTAFRDGAGPQPAASRS